MSVILIMLTTVGTWRSTDIYGDFYSQDSPKNTDQNLQFVFWKYFCNKDFNFLSTK